MDEAERHCAAGIGIWEWASNDRGAEPDVVMACCGDVPTLETLAAVDLLRRHAPDLKVRVINVVDLMRLQPPSEHPHGLNDRDFDALFTTDKPIIFAFHGYPWLIHRLAYRRHCHPNLHVRGYKEEGTTSTPFDMCVMNDLDRFHLAGDVIDRVPKLGARAAYAKQAIRDKLMEHKAYICRHGIDMPEIADWAWGSVRPPQVRARPNGQRLRRDSAGRPRAGMVNAGACVPRASAGGEATPRGKANGETNGGLLAIREVRLGFCMRIHGLLRIAGRNAARAPFRRARSRRRQRRSRACPISKRHTNGHRRYRYISISCQSAHAWPSVDGPAQISGRGSDSTRS